MNRPAIQYEEGNGPSDFIERGGVSEHMSDNQPLERDPIIELC
jgi:hypothetical protein